MEMQGLWPTKRTKTGARLLPHITSTGHMCGVWSVMGDVDKPGQELKTISLMFTAHLGSNWSRSDVARR